MNETARLNITALQFAIALGLQVQNEDRTVSDLKREVLVRVLWSRYHLERQVGIMTGRPSVIVEQFCLVPLQTSLPKQHILEDTLVE